MEWTKTVNVDVQQNILAGIKAGLLIPLIKYRKKLTDEEDYELYHSKKWLPDGPVFIENIRGPRLTINGLWDGERILYPTLAMNFRGLLNNDQGVMLDSNAVTLFENKTGYGVKELEKLARYVNTHQPYEGWMSLDIVVGPDASMYYNYVRIGIPVDFCVALESLYGVPYDQFQTHDNFPLADNFATVLKLYGYPYGEDIAHLVGELPVIWTGDSYVVTARSNKVNKAWAELYSQIPDHYSRIGLCYRTDGLTVSKRMFEELQNSEVFNVK